MLDIERNIHYQIFKKIKKITFTIVYPGYDFINLTNFVLAFFSVIFFRKKNSIIVFQKIFTAGIYTTALKIILFFRPKNTIYDIDDAEHVRRPVQTINYFMKKCSMCSVGSESLIEYVKRFNSEVLYLTSPIIEHGVSKSYLEKVFTIGWIGYYGAHKYNLLQFFFPALLEVDIPIILKIVGVTNNKDEDEIRFYFKNNENISIDIPRNLDWINELSIYKLISSFDIGVSPLIDNEFNRGKSAFKLKQYLSCGVPVLGSSVGENKRFLIDGHNGYFCDNPQEYFEKIIYLKCLDLYKFKELSINAKSTFSSFSIEYYCSVLISYFNSKTYM